MKQPFPEEEKAKGCQYGYFDSYFSEVICTRRQSLAELQFGIVLLKISKFAQKTRHNKNGSKN